MFLTKKERLQNNLIQDGIHEWAESALVPQFVRRKDTVFDVGANIGYYSLLFSRLVGPNGHVHAFEPLAVNYQRLRRNVEINEECSNVSLHNIALGDKAKTANYRFNSTIKDKSILPNFGGWTMLGNQDEDRGNVTIVTEKMDYFFNTNNIPKVQFLKVDVEGFENNVILGGQKVIKKCKPIIMIEFVETRVSPKEKLLELKDILETLGYTICKACKKPWPHVRKVNEGDFEAERIHFNAFCFYGTPDVPL